MVSFQTVLLLRRRRIAKSGIWCFSDFFRVQFRISSADSAGSVYVERGLGHRVAAAPGRAYETDYAQKPETQTIPSDCSSAPAFEANRVWHKVQ